VALLIRHVALACEGARVLPKDARGAGDPSVIPAHLPGRAQLVKLAGKPMAKWPRRIFRI
jgi:hypothetical protein